MPAKTSNFANDLVRQGYAVVRNVVPADMQQKLRDLCTQSPQQFTARRQGESYSIRHLLSALPGLREIANAPPLIDLAIAVLGDAVRPVKGVFFDKTPLANWPVPWHQDATITVQERIDVPGFEMRPVKDGVVHTRPPLDVSENLLTLRIHLDDTGLEHALCASSRARIWPVDCRPRMSMIGSPTEPNTLWRSPPVT